MITIARHFHRYILEQPEHPDGVEVSLQLRAPLPPIRGKVRILDDEGIYELAMPSGDGQRTFIVPIVFAGDDVLWYGKAPSVSEQPAIVTPGAGGLSVGGRVPRA